MTTEIYTGMSKINRTSSRSARPGLSWCRHCDLSLVGDGAKCKVCGQRHKRRRDKK